MCRKKSKEIKELKETLELVLKSSEEMYTIVEKMIISTDEVKSMQQYVQDFNFLNEESKIRNDAVIETLAKIYWAQEEKENHLKNLSLKPITNAQRRNRRNNSHY